MRYLCVIAAFVIGSVGLGAAAAADNGLVDRGVDKPRIDGVRPDDDAVVWFEDDWDTVCTETLTHVVCGPSNRIE